MNKYIFTKMLVEAYNRNPTDIVKRKRGHVPEITFDDLCYKIFELENITLVSKSFGITHKTLKSALVDAFPDIAEVKDKSTVWRVELLLKLGYRRCVTCKEDKALEEFYNSKSVKAGKSYDCKDCSKEANKQQRIHRPEIIRASNAKRKAIIKGASLNGANLDLIKKIYKECPEGYQVDHIYPLSKGGDHHESNLCYLPAQLNLQKQAKSPEEVPEIMKYAIYPDLSQ